MKVCICSLKDKEAGRARFGTGLSKHHELLLVLLIRVCDYKLGAADLLEMVDGDVFDAMLEEKGGVDPIRGDIVLDLVPTPDE